MRLRCFTNLRQLDEETRAYVLGGVTPPRWRLEPWILALLHREKPTPPTGARRTRQSSEGGEIVRCAGFTVEVGTGCRILLASFLISSVQDPRQEPQALDQFPWGALPIITRRPILLMSSPRSMIPSASITSPGTQGS